LIERDLQLAYVARFLALAVVQEIAIGFVAERRIETGIGLLG
jgi:hypothetical protein